MNIKKPFDTATLSHLDVSTRAMVDRSYDLCIYQCNELRETHMMSCKQACFNRIQVPFRRANHLGRDNEETNYRRCLANSKNFPSLTQDDYMTCSNNLFADRVETLSNTVAEEAQRIFQTSRDS